MKIIAVWLAIALVVTMAIAVGLAMDSARGKRRWDAYVQEQWNINEAEIQECRSLGGIPIMAEDITYQYHRLGDCRFPPNGAHVISCQ